MDSTPLERVFRQDRRVVLGAIVAVSAAAWAYVVWLATTMDMSGQAMDMPGMMMAPTFQPWSTADFVLIWLMWAVMMVGMMLPSVAPMVLIYARVARQALAQGKPFAASGWFVTGYLLSWAGFSLLATAAQWGLEQAALLSPMTMAADYLVGATLLILAGLYQWTPLKGACLTQCQAPLIFIQRHGGFRQEPTGSVRLGAEPGLYCIGCCWALMLLLFAGGVMNVLWIAAIAGFVLLEKVFAAGRMLSRAAGAGLIVAGLWLMAGG